MNTLIKTKGFRAGEANVPAFALNKGEWLVLRWPVNFGSDSENRFYDALSCHSACHDLAVRAAARIVVPVGKWAEPFYRHRNVGELLAALTSDDRDRLNNEIGPRQLTLHTPLDHLPGTVRALAGLMIASASGEVLVFNTAGLDPMGVQKVHAYVADKMKEGVSFIELEFPSSGQKQVRPVGVPVLDVRQG